MADFYCILTDIGKAKLAAAIAGGETISLTEMAVGDGDGNPTTPDPTQTELVRETYRDAINQLYEGESDPTMIVAELAIPMGTGGWAIHEVGVFDTDGDMFAVSNFPATYKPAPGSGADRDLLVRVVMKISDAGSVTLILDPAAILASREWVINNFSVSAALPGGTTGQVLTKQSNADGDADWQDPTDVNVSVDTIEEGQELAALQTVVTLATVTTTGLAVYIDGTRLRGPSDPNPEWAPDTATQLTLASAYPALSKFTGVQNEPAGLLGEPLQAAQNLSDVANVGTARTNLSVYSKVETDAIGDLKLAKAQNLADVPNKATGRANLSVYSIAQTDAADNNRLLKTANLSDVPNKATGRANLQVYSIAQVDTMVAAMLAKAQNLLDLPNKATARTNLGVYSIAQVDQRAPPGEVCWFARSTVPAGFLEANGGLGNRTTHAALFAVLGTFWGIGDGSTTFGLPDLRGEFPRGWDHGRGVDAARAFGSAQADDNKAHTHGVLFGGAAKPLAKVEADNLGGSSNSDMGGGDNNTNRLALTLASSGGTEARPRNVALLVCIRY